jgi:hypothetical protein
MTCLIAVMLLLRNSVEISLAGVSSSASDAVNSLWMHCDANSQSLSFVRLAMGLQQLLNIVLINALQSCFISQFDNIVDNCSLFKLLLSCCMFLAVASSTLQLSSLESLCSRLL